MMRIWLTAVVVLVSGAAVAQQSPPPAPTNLSTAPSGSTAVPGKTPGPDNPQQTIAERIAANKQLMDINTATAAQLKTLPGMGDAYVSRIIAGRPYTAKNQLVQRGILPQTEYAKIANLIVAHRPAKGK